MFKKNFLTVLKKCSASVLVFALSLILALPSTCGFAVGAENTEETSAVTKQLHVTTTGDGNFSAYTQKLTANTEYTVSFRYHFSVGSLDNVSVQKADGSNWETYKAIDKQSAADSDYYEVSYTFTQLEEVGVDIGFKIVGTVDFELADIKLYASNDTSRTNLFQFDLENGLSGFRKIGAAGDYGVNATIGSCTLTAEDYDDTIFKTPSKKMIRYFNQNQQAGIYTPVTVKANKTYRVSFKYKLSQGAFATNNGAGITLRVYNSGLNAVVATTYSNGSFAVSDESGWYVYTATLTPNADNSGYLGIIANNGDKSKTELYIADLTMYDTEDEKQTGLLNISSRDSDLSGWRLKTVATLSGTEYSDENQSISLMEYDDSYFRIPSEKMIRLYNSGVMDGICTPVTVSAGKTYKVSFKYKLAQGAFATNNGAGITVRVYNGGLNGVVATTYSNGSFSVSDESGWYVYTATLTPTADNVGYLGIIANNGDNSETELYIAGLTMYNQADETNTNILQVSGKTNDLNGWKLKSGTELSDTTFSNTNTTVELLEYDETYFKLPERKTIQISCTSSVGGENYLYPFFGQNVKLTAGTEYTLTYKYKNYGSCSLNNGYYLVVAAKTLWKTALNSSQNDFTIVQADDYYSNECTFIAPDGVGTEVFVGFYFSIPLQLDIADFVLYETADESKTNLLSGKPETYDLAGWRDDNADTDLLGMTAYTYNGDRGSYTASLIDYNDANFLKKATGDVNTDNSIDIRDLVHLKKLISQDKYSVMADINCDSELDATDLTYMRQLLLGIITIDDVVTPAVKPEQTLSGGADAAALTLKKTISENADSITVTGTKYYVSQNGNDANDGKSEDNPLKTVAAVNSLSLSEGDAVFFERGSQFRTETPLNVVTGVNYGAYGTGEKPIISGSLKDYASESLWIASAYENIWMLSLPGNRQAGVITFNKDASCGHRRFSISYVAANGDYYHDLENGVLYLYLKDGNPGEYFDSIEIGTTAILVNGMPDSGVKRNNITLQNLSLKYATKLGMDFEYSTGISVVGCEFSWIGGAVYGALNGENTIRMGNAVQFWAQAVNCKVEYSSFKQIFDAAITFQGATSSEQCFTGISFDNNLIEYCSMNIEFWGANEAKNDTSNTVIKEVSVTNNIVRFGGYGWGGRQRYDISNQAMLLCWNFEYSEDNINNVTVSGNILDCANCYFFYASTSLLNVITFSGNSYYQKISMHNVGVTRGGTAAVEGQEQFETEIKKIDADPANVYWLE